MYNLSMNINELEKKLLMIETKELQNDWNLFDFKNKVILTFGTFDLLHIGHKKIIDHCVSVAGDESKVIIGVSSDRWNQLKGKKSSQNQTERISKLKESYPEATIILEDHSEYEESWPKIWDDKNIDLIIMGGDHYDNLSYINKLKSDSGKQMKIAFFERTPEISSTLIRKQYK